MINISPTSTSHPIPALTMPVFEFLVGDLLLTFDGDKKGIPARHSEVEWHCSAEAGSWQMWQQAWGMDWRGMPGLSFSTAGWQLWLLGELYGTPNVPQFLRELVEGCRDAAGLNGHFLLFAWEEAAERWHVWTDRMGTLHAYYAYDGHRAALGTFFPAVAAVASQRKLDWEALTGFFGMGFFGGDSTFYTDVRALRPATHYIFSNEGVLLQQERYWQWNHAPNEQRSYADTIDEFASLIETVMWELTADGRVALPISGGLDSRTTVAALASSKREYSHLWAYSYGYSDDSAETAIARQVAAARRLPFQSLIIQPYLFERLPLVMASLEGFQDVTQARQASVIKELGQHADAVIAAHWGDVWFDDMGLADSHNHSGRAMHQPAGPDPIHDYAIKKMVKGGRQWLLDHLCQAQLQGQSPAALMDRFIGASLQEVAHISEPDFRMKALKSEQWSARWTTTSMRMFQAAAFPRLPFYDTRMIDFFCTVPTGYVRGRQMQIDYLKRYAPDLARITWQVYDANLYRYQQFNTWQLPKRTVKKAWRELRRHVARRPVFERNWEVQFLNENGRQGLQQWLLRPGLRLHEFAAPQAIAALLNAFYADPLADKRGYTVSMLLSFSAWLEQYG